MDEIKFTPEELKSIAELQKQFAALTFRFGQLYLEKHAIDRQMVQNAGNFDETEKEFESLRNEEKKLADLLQMKYGSGQLNLETGVFTPVQAPAQS